MKHGTLSAKLLFWLKWSITVRFMECFLNIYGGSCNDSVHGNHKKHTIHLHYMWFSLKL